MDVLSDVIALMRTGRPLTARDRKCGPWSERHGPFPGAGFHVVLRGGCWLIPIEGEPIALGMGDVVLLPRGTEHALAYSPDLPVADIPRAHHAPLEGSAPADVHVVPLALTDGVSADLLCGAYQLDQDRTHPFLAEMPDIVHLPATVGSRPALRGAVDLLGADLEQARPGSSAALTALLDLLLIYIMRAYTEDCAARPGGCGWPAALTDTGIATALHSMHQDPAKPWTVQELGAQAGLSRAAFARRFTMLVGQPPLAYLTWWRLATAARMLRESEAPLAAIASRVGYSSQFAFANAFKREYGLAPGSYRKGRRDELQLTGTEQAAG
ncbi:AraC family transcriptional regulator [Streptomyces sp. PRKS01-29]|nr:AraC family transcriptional regulator [Streptomyces sabulosicollis]MBI0293326.1 AraC family transcriptional regulator [Streptomyces sabulosicollis]